MTELLSAIYALETAYVAIVKATKARVPIRPLLGETTLKFSQYVDIEKMMTARRSQEMQMSLVYSCTRLLDFMAKRAEIARVIQLRAAELSRRIARNNPTWMDLTKDSNMMAELVELLDALELTLQPSESSVWIEVGILRSAVQQL